MMTIFNPNHLIIVGAVLYLGLYFFFGWRYSRNVSQIFSRTGFDNPSLESVYRMTDEINTESKVFQFYPAQRVNLLFKGKPVLVVNGRAGHASAAGRTGAAWHSDKCVFVIADVKETDWMRQNKGVFELVFEGTSYCVSW